MNLETRLNISARDSENNLDMLAVASILDGTHTPHDYVCASDEPSRKAWWSWKLGRSGMNQLVDFDMVGFITACSVCEKAMCARNGWWLYVGQSWPAAKADIEITKQEWNQIIEGMNCEKERVLADRAWSVSTLNDYGDSEILLSGHVKPK